MATLVGRSMWASSSSTQLSSARGASCRHTLTPAFFISRQPEYTLAPKPLTSMMPRPFASASASEKPPTAGFKKPEVIPWQENMPINSATFVGTVTRDMQIQYLDSGKIVANSSIKVKRVLKDDSWFYVEFWGDLAEVAAAHLKKDDLIFVSGSVWPEKVIGRDGLEKTFAKVVVKDLKFVQQSSNRESTINDLSTYGLWKDLFDNRADWIDTRERKTNERYPDFKHKYAERALWLNNKLTPDWVKERLQKEAEGPQILGKS